MVDWWLQLALYGPAAFFGLCFLVSAHREPRRFRNAIFLALFVIFLASALLLRFGTTKVLIPLALLVVLVPLFVLMFLLVNFFVVIRHEGLKLSTSLPALFALAMVAVATVFPWAVRPGVPFWIHGVGLLVIGESLWFFFSFASLLLYSTIYRLFPRRRKYDYILIHGAGLNGTKPTPLLRGRIDRAYELWRRQGARAMFVVSGGKGSDEEVSEAEAMRTYLEEVRHVSPDCIITEDESTTTLENLRNAKALMDAHGKDYRVALVTSDYHVFRACEYAHGMGLAADGVGSHTRGYYWPTAFIREFIAVSKAHVWPYLLIALIWLCWIAAIWFPRLA